MEKLQEIKENIAISKRYREWSDYINDQPNYMVEQIMDEVAIEYSSELLRQNREMKEALEDILKIYKDATDESAYWFAKNCLTSCNKGKDTTS